MSVQTNVIIDILTKVIDPGSGQDLITMSMVRDLKVEGDNVSFILEVNALDAEQKQKLNFACMGAIQEKYPSANVHIHMKGRGEVAGEAPKGRSTPLPQVKNVIAVASGKGGVGKSTVSVNLALALKAQGAKVGLLDADLYGPSIPKMLGLQGQRPKLKTVYDKPKIVPIDYAGMPVMSVGFVVEPDQAVILRGPRLAGLLSQFIKDCIWPELDYLIIDLPPGTGDIQLTLVQTLPVTGAVMVTTPQDVAVIDAVKAMNMFLNPSVNVPILGVVENMSWFTPAELPNNKYRIFGEGGGQKLAEQCDSHVIGQIPLVMGVREGGDSGRPVVLQEDNVAANAFFGMAEKLVKHVAFRNQNMAPTDTVKITHS